MELIVLDRNLLRLGTVVTKSLIWIDRYNRVGSCEIYAPATVGNVGLLKEGRYVKRTDRKSPFEIKAIFISGDEDSGEFITAYAYDCKGFLDQRINTTVTLFQSYNAGNDLLSLLQQQVLGGQAASPFLKENGSALFSTRPPATVGGVCNQSVAFQPWGEITRQICGYLGYGYRCDYLGMENPGGQQLRIDIYAGQDRSRSVRFSRAFGNVGTESYEVDTRNKGNVVLVKSDKSSTIAVYGSGEGTDRVEKWLDSYADPAQSYGTLRGIIDGTLTLAQAGSSVVLNAAQLYVPILSPWQLNRLRARYPGGNTSQREGYFYIAGPVGIGSAANTTVADVSDSTGFIVLDVVFDYLLLAEAAEAAKEYGVIDEANVEITDDRFVYGQDYNLGDLVLVQSAYGPSSVARIVEVLECWDDNGYRLEPRTSYSEV